MRPEMDTNQSPTPKQVFAQIANEPGAVWLDGGAANTGWSIIAWSPTEVVTDEAQWPDQLRRLGQPTTAPSSLPFDGGVIGYIGFGAGHVVESVLKCATTPEPNVWLGRYEGALCYNHLENSWHIGGDSEPVSKRANELLQRAVPLSPPVNGPQPLRVSSVCQHDYEQGVREIQCLITAGDCYQVNLTRAVSINYEENPDHFNLYRRLRTISDASFGAMLRLSSTLSVLSNSPELLLRAAGATVISEPIKGTRPRAECPDLDSQHSADLHDSEKECAELTMIVDLVRNDLNRVCEPGTITASPRVIRSHATVHHASQEVRGTLRSEKDNADALASLFPPGSVIGAPKIRAARRIAELESSPRGVYCGSIGMYSGQKASFSVAIRTAVCNGNQARYHVGGGIVFDSDPTLEWEETIHKGAALHNALCGG